MKTIHLLPDYLISQIAAGEVIERPAYAVKELIENAIDANAKHIHIELQDYGLAKIVVTDDGFGMQKQDLVESFKLHTTSKVSGADALLSIKSLGFRGEALASIAAVSFLTLESKTATDMAGTKINVSNQKIHTITSLGMPTGTRVIVEQLFQAVPARKKFLKSKRTEYKHILDVVYSQAIASPSIAFSVSHEGQSILHLPHSQNLNERISSLYEGDVSNNLLPVHLTESYLTISGYILKPQQSSRVIPKQFVSINGRPISDRLIELAVKESYGILLEKDIKPSWFLHISLPSESLNVNIHPRKEQVQFSEQRFLFDMIGKAVSETLHGNTIHYAGFSQRVYPSEEKITQTSLGKNLKHSVLPWNNTLLTNLSSPAIVQIHTVYILATTEHGFLLIDQHAAHERILYEKFLTQFINEAKKGLSDPLEQPLLLHLSPSEGILLEENLEDLERIGFHIENFSGNTYNITNIPRIFKNRNLEKTIPQLLTELQNESFSRLVDSKSKKLLAYLSCRSAVQSGDPLTEQQMVDIIKELENIPEAITCPHGRPVKIAISLTELHKMFKRR